MANKHCKALPHYKICKEEKNEKRAIFQNIFDLLWDSVTKGWQTLTCVRISLTAKTWTKPEMYQWRKYSIFNFAILIKLSAFIVFKQQRKNNISSSTGLREYRTKCGQKIYIFLKKDKPDHGGSCWWWWWWREDEAEDDHDHDVENDEGPFTPIWEYTLAPGGGASGECNNVCSLALSDRGSTFL